MIDIASRYVDNAAIVQIIGTIFKTPQLLDFNEKYTITEDDFPDMFHKVLFGSIYKLHELGIEKITTTEIADYLSNRPKSNEVYQKQKGEEWLEQAIEVAVPDAFDYYYSRLKKFSLLRAYDNCGVDVSFIYDTNLLLDIKKKQLQEELLDNAQLEEIALKVENKIDEIKLKYVDNVYSEARQMGEGALNLIERYKQKPDIGIPMYGSLINTVFRGARLGKYYIRSAGTNIGKTRAMVADACYFSCGQIYDDNFGWINLPSRQPTLYIAVEQDMDEIQTMMLAFLSNVQEDHIVYGKYEEGEEERVIKAANILANAPFYFEYLPDFSLQDVENTIVKNIREHDISYVVYDYLLTSLKILEEISKKSGGVKIREDNVLFMLSARLKDICTTHGVFILTSTQLSGEFRNAETPDQSLLRGQLWALIYLIQFITGVYY